MTLTKFRWPILLLPLMIHFQAILAQPSRFGPPVLSAAEMYADFDTLTKMIVEINPQIEVRKKVTGIDIPSELKKLRGNIQSIDNITDFAILIRDALTVCQDGHTSILKKGYYPSDSAYLQQGISTNALKLQPIYDSLLNASLLHKKFNLQLRYINGQYFNVYPFTYSSKLVKEGYRLVSCNDIDINTYVQSLISSKRMMRWDFKKMQWFSEDFYNSYKLTFSDTLLLGFTSPDQKLIRVKFCLKDSLPMGGSSVTSSSMQKRVEYFDSEKILYIRLPEMEEGNFYVKKILEVANNKEILKVVIDIRDNPGGSDFVWVGILQSILSDPIIQENLILCNDSQLMKSAFPNDSQYWVPHHSPFITDSRLAVFYKGQSILKPDSNSINFSGPIYVIQNENIYSSAGSLAAVGMLSDKITTIGAPTGRLLGKGISPFIFELPYSKIMYRIEPVIDFMNVDRPEDIFHDEVEIPIELSIDQYLQRIRYKDNVYSKEYLLNRDPVFRTILLK